MSIPEDIERPIITYAEARAKGLARYFTGKPCLRGHFSERGIGKRNCLACCAGYSAKNRAKNPGKYLEANRKLCRRWRGKNRQKNLDTAKAWRQRYPDRVKQFALDWRKNNPEKAHALDARNRTRRKNVSGAFDDKDVERIFKAQRGRCAYCHITISGGYHVDHIIPIVRGGSNFPKNIQLACANCNWAKHAKDPIQFAQERGWLL